MSAKAKKLEDLMNKVFSFRVDDPKIAQTLGELIGPGI